MIRMFMPFAYRLFILVCVAAAAQIITSASDFARTHVMQIQLRVGLGSNSTTWHGLLFSSSSVSGSTSFHQGNTTNSTTSSSGDALRPVRRWPQNLSPLSHPLRVVEVENSIIRPVQLSPLPTPDAPPKPDVAPTTCISLPDPESTSAAITVFAASNIDGSVAFRVRQDPSPHVSLEESESESGFKLSADPSQAAAARANGDSALVDDEEGESVAAGISTTTSSTATGSMQECIDQSHGPRYDGCQLQHSRWGSRYYAFEGGACKRQKKGLGPEATTWVDKVDCRTPEGAHRQALQRDTSTTNTTSSSVSGAFVEVQWIGAKNVTVYHFPASIPVIFWNRTEGPYLDNIYHATSRLMVLLDILVQAGMSTDGGDELKGSSLNHNALPEDAFGVPSASINRNTQIVVLDNYPQFLESFEPLLSALSRRRFLYNEPPTGRISRPAFAVCAPHAVVAKDPTLEGLDVVDLTNPQARTMTFKYIMPVEGNDGNDQLVDFESDFSSSSESKSELESKLESRSAPYRQSYRRFVHQIFRQLMRDDELQVKGSIKVGPLIPQNAKPVRPRIVFIVRKPGNAKARNIINEAKLRAQLRPPPGFPDIEYLYFENKTFHQQIALVLNATVLLGLHGAGLTHGLYMAKGGTVVEMYPSKWSAWKRVQIYANNAVLTGKHFIRMYYDQPRWHSGKRLTWKQLRNWSPTLNVTEVQDVIDLACGQGVNAQFNLN